MPDRVLMMLLDAPSAVHWLFVFQYLCHALRKNSACTPVTWKYDMHSLDEIQGLR